MRFSTVPRVTCLVSEQSDPAVIAELAAVGVDGFQVRSKELDTRGLIELTRAVVAAVRPTGAMVTVNDRVDVAIASGADGAHLGAGDLPMAVARSIAPALLLGATCRSFGDVEAAAADGADYVGVGPVFATTSKAGLPDPVGIMGIKGAGGPLPIVAIGGITAANASAVMAAGAAGIAVIGGIWRPPDPVRAAEELLAAIG
ncbi:MAG: thiamine phosphate synthase [Propionibacteriales bacterium]|nr:thiamine phosphate synthase [Propionibacteriales bacterium]